MKNLGFALTSAVVLFAAPVQAQWTALGTPGNDGGQFWDNLSDDGLTLGNPQVTANTCNVGFILTNTSGDQCINQRPAGWLPYVGATPTQFFSNDGSAPSNFLFGPGSFSFSLLEGSPDGGDLAGQNRDWGYFDFATMTRTSLGSLGALPAAPIVFTGIWGLWLETIQDNYAYSHIDSQIALFGYGVNSSDDGTNWIVGMEDNRAGDWDYQDMMFRIVAEDGGTPQETVPEPATMTLLATGLAGMAAARRRKNQKQS